MTELSLNIECMFAVAALIAPLFIIVAASALVQKRMAFDRSIIKILNGYALNIGLPALLFYAIASTQFSWQHASGLIVISSIYFVCIFLGTLGIGKLIHVPAQLLRTLVICLGLGNVAFLGIPVIELTYGEAALADAGVIVAVYLFWVFTLGIGYLEWSARIKHHLGSLEWSTYWGRRVEFQDLFLSLIKNPILIAVFAGSLVSVMAIPLPTELFKSVELIAHSVTPLVLIIVGLFIGSSQVGQWRDWLPVVGFSSLVLVFFPLLLYVSLASATGTPELFATTIISAAMPLAITPFALADTYKLDKMFIARAIVLSTILSAITIPIWVFYLQ